MMIKGTFHQGGVTAVLVAFAVLLISLDLASGEQNDLKRPEITVAFFYADWDPVCQRVDTAMERLANKYEGQPVLGIVFDISNQSDRYHAELLASALGLDETWIFNEDKTGIAYIVDSESGQILDTLTDEDDMASSAAKVDVALEKVSN